VLQRQLLQIEKAPYREAKETIEQDTTVLVAKH
jgi:hypothetical protein